MTTILWTIYWTGALYCLLDTLPVALEIHEEQGGGSSVNWPLSVLLTSALWPIGRLLRVIAIIRLARVKDNG